MPKHSRYPVLPMPATHAQIVSHYIKYRRPDFADELAWFAEPASFPAALLRAVNAKSRSGKRLSHQWRLGRQVIPATLSRLRPEQSKISAARTFHRLYEVIATAMKGIPGAGELYAYDTALRLGAFSKLSPDEVFLQAGTLEGAKKLLRRVRGRSIPLHSFPKDFWSLTAAEMEHLLCSYRSYF